jgi:hypothetical protein
MYCKICNDKIENDGIIKFGTPYHSICYEKYNKEAKDSKTRNMIAIEEADEWLVDFFTDNPLLLKKALENKYFAVIRAVEKNSCTEDEFHIESAKTLEEFERLLKKRVLIFPTEKYEYNIDYLIVDQKVTRHYSIDVKLNLFNDDYNRKLSSQSFGENISRTALLLNEAFENDDMRRVGGLIELLLHRIKSLSSNNYLNEENHTKNLIKKIDMKDQTVFQHRV